MQGEAIAFVEGVVVRPDLVFISALVGERTKVIQWRDGVCAHFIIDWPCTSLTACADPLAVYAMGPEGDIHVFAADGRRRETIAGPDRHGPLRAMRMIGGVNYAAGMQRQVARRHDSGAWELLGAPILNTDGIRGFNCIDGYSEQDIYAAGMAGELWRFDGAQWRQLASPSSMSLQRMVCAGDGRVYIVGQAGLIVAGRDTQWTVLDTGDERHDLWGCAWFDGHLYVASSSAVYQWTGSKLRACDIGATGRGCASFLMAGHGMLWSIGQRYIAYSRDGVRWTDVTNDAAAC